jgi:hypothetical protein
MLTTIKSFAVYAGERALKTLAQTALTMIVAANGLMDVSWVHVVDVVGLATLASILTSIMTVTRGAQKASEPELDGTPEPDAIEEVPAS